MERLMKMNKILKCENCSKKIKRITKWPKFKLDQSELNAQTIELEVKYLTTHIFKVFVNSKFGNFEHLKQEITEGGSINEINIDTSLRYEIEDDLFRRILILKDSHDKYLNAILSQSNKAVIGRIKIDFIKNQLDQLNNDAKLEEMSNNLIISSVVNIDELYERIHRLLKISKETKKILEILLWIFK